MRPWDFADTPPARSLLPEAARRAKVCATPQEITLSSRWRQPGSGDPKRPTTARIWGHEMINNATLSAGSTEIRIRCTAPPAHWLAKSAIHGINVRRRLLGGFPQISLVYSRKPCNRLWFFTQSGVCGGCRLSRVKAPPTASAALAGIAVMGDKAPPMRLALPF